jgi:hypothetical protein
MVDEYWEDYLKRNMPIFDIDLSLFLKILKKINIKKTK